MSEQCPLSMHPERLYEYVGEEKPGVFGGLKFALYAYPTTMPDAFVRLDNNLDF